MSDLLKSPYFKPLFADVNKYCVGGLDAEKEGAILKV